jgi:eukaryotic-like serine/threonine-protein kinase
VDNFPAESLDNFDRNRWTTSNGTGGQLQTEWLDNINRNTHYPQAWSKDGRYLAYAKGKGSKWTIYILPLFGERKPFPIDLSSSSQWRPSFSYDGRWVAYGSIEAGEPQVFLKSFPAADQKLQVSNEGGVEPQWRMDGRELYYLSPVGKLMAVDIVAGNQIKAGIPRVLFDTKLSIRGDGSNHYAVTPDGQRFLLLKPVTEGPPAPITVVLNWPSLIKQ